MFLNWNKDTVDDQVIFDHLTELSDGKLSVKEDLLPLTPLQRPTQNEVQKWEWA